MPRSRLAIAGVVAFGLCVLAVSCDSGDASPWLFCTTNPCQPLALVELPAPPALSNDASLAATCELAGDDGREGILLWHTDWDTSTREGLCVTREEARDFGADVR